MIEYLYIFAATDRHIDFISQEPVALWNYMEGSKCTLPAARPAANFLKKIIDGEEESQGLVETPSGWPTKYAEVLGPEINNHTVDLYHEILSAGEGAYSPAKSFFETWLSSDVADAIDIGGDGENFAFMSTFIPELKKLAEAVDEERVRNMYDLWLRKEGKENVKIDKDVTALLKEFNELATNLQKVEEEGKGLILVRT